MAEPGSRPDRAAMMKILLPAGAVAAVVVVVAVLWSSSGGGMAMSDGSNGSDSDAELVTVSEGVKIRDIKLGHGDAIKPGETAKVKYKGWLTDGTVFDSADGSEFAVTHGPGGVVKGWSEGIPGMKIGGTRKLVVAPEQGYGSSGRGKIPANATLVFEVTLLEIKPPPLAPPPPRPTREPSLKMSDGTDPTAPDANLIEVRPGLKYRDLKVGEGPATSETATIVIEYTGWLMNGKVFDSTRPKTHPATFGLSGSLISGWKLGVPGMKPGGIRKLVVSPEMAYANQKKDGIPPGSTLIFEIEMLNSR